MHINGVIVDYDRYFPAIDSVFSSISSMFWSGSAYVSNSDHAWCVYFYYGHVYYYHKTSSYYVRCVRSGPYWLFDPLNYLVIKNDDVVEDIRTELEWQRHDDNVERNWSDACQYCDDLILDGHDDWRIPEVEELSSIVDYTDYGLSISTEVFSSKSDHYWSGSANVGSSDYAWYVHFNDGHVNAYYESDSNYVRCVRSGPL